LDVVNEIGTAAGQFELGAEVECVWVSRDEDPQHEPRQTVQIHSIRNSSVYEKEVKLTSTSLGG
jgi:hypothetical protein